MSAYEVKLRVQSRLGAHDRLTIEVEADSVAEAMTTGAKLVRVANAAKGRQVTVHPFAARKLCPCKPRQECAAGF